MYPLGVPGVWHPLHINVTKETYLKDKLGSCTVKEVYRIIHSLLNRKSSHLPLYDSASRLADQFSSFFVGKIRKIRDEVDACNGLVETQFGDTVNENIPLLENFQLLTQSDLSTIIMSSATKSCRLDPITTWLLKENLDHVLPLLTSIVNPPGGGGGGGTSILKVTGTCRWTGYDFAHQY